MLTLQRQKAKLLNLNPRMEVHGDEHVPAADLKFVFLSPNDVLSEFDPALKSSFYRKPDVDDRQLELSHEAGWLPKLRFPRLGPIEWEQEIVGGVLTVHYGIGSDFQIPVVTADKFRFELRDGGSVSVSFRVQCRPDGSQFGRLWSLLQEDVELSLDPPDQEGFVRLGEAIEEALT